MHTLHLRQVKVPTCSCVLSVGFSSVSTFRIFTDSPRSSATYRV